MRMNSRIIRAKDKLLKSYSRPDQENQLKSMCEEYGTVYLPPCECETIRDQKNPRHLSMNRKVKKGKKKTSVKLSHLIISINKADHPLPLQK